jgi:acyl dehydratase
MVTTANGLEELTGLAGADLGSGPWHSIEQAQVNTFADATGDHQWIHVDPVAAATGPFGGAIAHGYLTLALVPVLLQEIFRVEGATVTVNYGLDRVRFPAPVPVGSRIRLTARLDDVATKADGKTAQVSIDCTIEIDGQNKPACVARVVLLWVFDESASA